MATKISQLPLSALNRTRTASAAKPIVAISQTAAKKGTCRALCTMPGKDMKPRNIAKAR